MRTTATLSGERLVVSTEGDRSVDYQVTFEPIDNGRSLRVTRRITDEDLRQPVVAKSVYDKTSDMPQLESTPASGVTTLAAGASGGSFVVPDGTQLVAVLNENLSTKQARDGDRFTLTVRSPSQYDGATIEGQSRRSAAPARSRAGPRCRSSSTPSVYVTAAPPNFAGYIESVRTTNDDTVRVDNEGRVQDEMARPGAR